MEERVLAVHHTTMPGGCMLTMKEAPLSAQCRMRILPLAGLGPR